MIRFSAVLLALPILGLASTVYSEGAYLAPGTPIGSDFVLGPTTPGKWGSATLGTGAAITWSLMPDGTSCAADAAGCTITALSSFLPGGFLTAIMNAFAAWAAVANVTFTQVADDGAAFNAATTSGDIRLGGHTFDGPGGTLAHGFYPPVNGLTAAGDIHLDTADTWKLGFGGPGFDVFQVVAHELGHALGLGHTAVPGSLMNAFYTEAFTGPQTDDISGAQFIYGAASAVPEPATWLLFTAGLLALSALGRKRQRLSR